MPGRNTGVPVPVAAVVSMASSKLLVGVSPLDPVTFPVVSAFLSTMAALASYFPARRAARADPTIALRHE